MALNPLTPTTQIHNQIGLDENGRLVSPLGMRVGAAVGQDYISSADIGRKVTLFDDFLGDVLEDGWSAAEGNDAQAIIATINSQVGGWVRMTTGDTATLSESGQALTHGLNWKAASGNLVFEARVKPVSSVADVAYFIGFHDSLATTALEEPVTLSTTTFTATADDAIGFVYDTAATTDVFYAIGVKATTKTAATALAAPVADTVVTLRIEVDTAGTAKFYVNGALGATIANAVTTTVALTPIVSAMARTTTSKSIDVDYILVQSDR